jgi:hypothetical protein
MLDIKLPKNHERGDKWTHCELCSTTRYWPKGLLIERNGRYYCKDHYRYKFFKSDLDDIILDIDEGDRGEP